MFQEEQCAIAVDNVVRRLLQARTVLHILHLMTHSHATHVALDGAYNLASESVDKIAEQAIGEGFEVLGDSAAYDPMSYLTGLIADLEKLSRSITCSDSLRNTLEETIGEFKQARYRLSLT
jgi:DNA-binding ferritin-like protein